LDQENDVDVSGASQSGTLDVEGEGEGGSMGDWDVVVPPAVSGEDSIDLGATTV
jgi:hypothetical protein